MPLWGGGGLVLVLHIYTLALRHRNPRDTRTYTRVGSRFCPQGGLLRLRLVRPAQSSLHFHAEMATALCLPGFLLSSVIESSPVYAGQRLPSGDSVDESNKSFPWSEPKSQHVII